jgi:transposase
VFASTSTVRRVKGDHVIAAWDVPEGLTSKIHALVDADGRPVALRLTGGQVHDSQEAEALLEVMPDGATLLGDKGYDSNAIREAAARKNAWANIPARSNRKQRYAFSGWVYRQRNLVERFFNRIKHFRGIATRYDKCPENYLAAVKLICAHLVCHLMSLRPNKTTSERRELVGSRRHANVRR